MRTKYRVLVVDDDPRQLRWMAFPLEKAGFEILTASHGIEAFYAALRDRPDAIVADIFMYGMDGLSLCANLRAEPPLSQTPIILISALDLSPEEKDEAIDLGASAVVVRTPDLRDLIDALRSLMTPNPVKT